MRSDERKVQLSPYKDSTESGDEDQGTELLGDIRQLNALKYQAMIYKI